jgi:hypothetical protein
MLRDYDIFEKFLDGSTMWRSCVFGRHEACRKLQDLAKCSPNEFVAIDIHTGEPLPAIVLHAAPARKLNSAANESHLRS